jgi:Ni/Fe-hydrogenase subunit HybB-like protein
VVEVGVFTAIPMALLLWAASRRDLTWLKVGAGMALVGIVLNRMNVSLIAFKWYAPVHYVPTWMELVVTAAVISAEVWVFRWVVQRMPVLGGEPAWARHHDAPRAAAAPAAPPALPRPIAARSATGAAES